MFFDYNELKKELIGTKIRKPLSGTLSGHAAGEPFDKHVYELIKSKLPSITFRQYEYLNKILLDNLAKTTVEEREQLIENNSVRMLIRRGKDATRSWSKTNQFEEKQDDTADILVTDNAFFDIIDIKTKDINKKSQPPNIISSFKLANLMTELIDNDEYDTLDITYIEIEWALEGDFLVCKNVYTASLFKENPKDLYINWAAAMQIQFHVSKLKQEYTGNMKEWAVEYIKAFIEQATGRAETMIEKFVTPFKKYIEE